MDANQRDQRTTGSSSPEEKSNAGIFITKGSQISIPEGGLVIRLGPEGQLETADLTIHIALHLTTYWLEIAYNHLRSSDAAAQDVASAVNAEDDTALGQALEREFMAAMQAMAAAAIAVDALYASIKERVEVPQSTVEAWRKNRTARFKQIAEVFRLGFQIGPKSYKQLASMLRELFRFRDWAVHPPSKASAPVLRVDIGKATEWRFAAFRFENARPAVQMALSMSAQLASRPKPKFPDLVQHCAGLQQMLAPLVSEWEARYGELSPRTQIAQADDSQAETSSNESA